MAICFLLGACACSSQKDCGCSEKCLYRKSVDTKNTWVNNKSIYEFLPEKAEVLQIVNTTTDSHYPQYDIIYIVHTCGK